MKSIKTAPKMSDCGGHHIGLELEWIEAGVTDGMDRARLISRDWVSVNGLSLHLMAIEVHEPDDGEGQRAVDPEFEDDLTHLISIDNTAYQTTEIEGREYIIYATPHGA